MEIKFLEPKREYFSIKGEIDEAVKRVLESGVFIGGKEVEKLEEEIAKLSCAKFAVSVNSGTDALFLSLKALGIKEGDEVITTPFTFIATAEVISALGAKPVFADINPETFNIDPDEIEKKITKRTKAIIPVHLFGKEAEMNKIVVIARKHKLFVVEDSCQAIRYRLLGIKEHKEKKKMIIRKRLGSRYRGDLTCFSFFPTKNLGAYGDGGMIITDSEKLAKIIRQLKNHGSSPYNKYHNLLIGHNSRLDAIQAAILRVKLKHLENCNKKRKEIAGRYFGKLESVEGIIMASSPESGTHDFNQYTIRAKNRDGLKKFLAEKGIETKIYYPLALHLQPAFKHLGYKKGEYPKAEKAAKEVLSLPIYPELLKKEIDFIISSIKKFFQKPINMRSATTLKSTDSPCVQRLRAI